MKKLDVIAAVLLVVGGLNWALVGAARFDLVAAIFGMHFGKNVCAQLGGVSAGRVVSAISGCLLESDPAALEHHPRRRARELNQSAGERTTLSR